MTIIEEKKLTVRFLYHILECYQLQIKELCTFDGIPTLNASNFKELDIPIPPIEIQNEIVRTLDAFTELTMRKNQYNYYRDKLLSFDDEIEWKSLGDVAEFTYGFAAKAQDEGT